MSIKQAIYDHFLARLRSGKIAVGQRLPTEKEIATQFSVSRSTVQAVMSRMMHEGLIRRQAGRGTFACAPEDNSVMRVNLDIHNIQSFEDEMAIAGDLVTYRLVSFSKSPAPPRAAAKLGIDAATPVLTLHRLRFVGEQCIGSEKRYFSPNIRMDIPASALETEGVHELIENGLGIKIGQIDAALRAVIANAEEARLMGIEPNAPLLVRSHTLLDSDGNVILYGASRYVEPFSFRYSANIRR